MYLGQRPVFPYTSFWQFSALISLFGAKILYEVYDIKYWFDGLEYLSEYNTWYGDFEIHVFLLWSVLSIFFFCVSLLALHRKFINEINFRNIYKKGWQMFMVNILILNIYSFWKYELDFPSRGLHVDITYRMLNHNAQYQSDSVKVMLFNIHYY